MIDVHSHLTFEDYDVDRDLVIMDAKKELKAVVISGVNPEDSTKALCLYEENKGFLYLMLGFHPIYANKYNDKDIERYLEFIKKNKDKIVGIGEIGLDYYWIKDSSEIKRSKDIFISFLDLAKEIDMPVLLHTRKAIDDGLKIIENEDIRKAVFHCFSGGTKLAREIWEEGYYISLATSIGRNKNMKKAAKSVPLDSLLTETDSPFLSNINEERNVPQNVKIVYQEISKLRDIDIDEVVRQVSENNHTLFNI
jgi:TatD DNase family protein